jgi:hypothetical protein
VTDSSDPKNPRSSRKKPAREPATIDLKATVIDDGSQQEKAWDDVKPEETILPETDVRAEDTVGSPEATLDSGANADSIESSAATDGIPPQDEVPPGVSPESVSPESPPPGSSFPGSTSPSDGPPGPVPERRTSPAALIGSGLLGGLIGAGLVYGLQLSQQQTPPPRDDQRLAQLEQRVNALGQSKPQTVDLSPIEGRLRTLEAARGSLDQRLQEIQDTANRAASRAEEAFNRPQPQPSAPPQDNTVVSELSDRLSTLENQVRTNAQNATDASSAVQGLDRRFGEQDQHLAALSQQMGQISEQVAQNSKAVETAGQTGTRVVLAERLGDALRNGTPYTDVLEGLRRTGTDPERLKALEPFAEKGAPTASAMLDGFEPLEARILRDERGASSAWSDRMLRMLDKVVTVRSVNEPGETGVSATLARIRQALARDDLKEAAAAWASLPEPARRISDEWGRQITALAGAQQASRGISEEAIAALNRSTQSKE